MFTFLGSQDTFPSIFLPDTSVISRAKANSVASAAMEFRSLGLDHRPTSSVTSKLIQKDLVLPKLKVGSRRLLKT